MEEKYGKKLSTMKVEGMVYLPLVMCALLVSAVFVIFLLKAINATAPAFIAIILGVVDAAVIGGLLRQILYLKVEIYEKHLVQYNMFNIRVISADDIRAILWQFPGANPMNSRAARVNNTSAEFIFKDSTAKSLKIQDSYYQDLEKQITAFQTRNNIPKDLEVQKKGGQRYSDI